MARPKKQGLDYFSFDVDAPDDDKFISIEVEHGPEACWIIVRLLCSLYRVGYCYRWGEREKKLFARRCHIDLETLDLIIETALDVNLFSRKVYEQTGFLTSKAIQSRWLEASRRRTKLREVEGVWVIDEFPQGFGDKNPSGTGVNAAETPVNAAETPQKLPLNATLSTEIERESKRESKGENESRNAPEREARPPDPPKDFPTDKPPPDTEPEPDVLTPRIEALFEQPDGSQPWESDPRFIGAGQRPLKKFPSVFMTTPEMRNQFERMLDLDFDQKDRNRALMIAESRISSDRAHGKTRGATGYQHVCWAIEQVLEERTKAHRAATAEEYRNNARDR